MGKTTDLKEAAVLFRARRHSVLYDPRVTLGDIGRWECADESKVKLIKKLPLHSFPPGKKKSQMEFFSVLEVIRRIHMELPGTKITVLGDEDFIVEYQNSDRTPEWINKCKLAAVCLLIFLGSAFTIMMFNNDVDVTGVFEQMYLQITGVKKPQVSELEVAYSIGLAVGILVFFNHLGHRKFSSDPTPIQVEITKFHRDLDDTLLENAQREGHEEDVS